MGKHLRESLLRRTATEWQGRYHEQLTDNDVREIVSNMVDYFEVLLEWNEQAHTE